MSWIACHRSIGPDFDKANRLIQMLNSLGVITIVDIYDYCMLFKNDNAEVFENELDSAISDLEQLLERNKEIPSHTNWGTEYETIYERDL